MGLLPIEQNYNFLGLTGGARRIGGVQQPVTWAAGGGEATPEFSGRAVDKLPKNGQFVNFTENLAAQAGYDRGISTKTLWV